MKTVGTILLITAMGAAAAVAQPGQGEMKMKNRPHLEKVADELDLTSEQREAIKAAQASFQEHMIDLRANVQKARLQVRKQMNQSTVNREELMKAVDAEGAADLLLRKAVVEQQLKVREIIGPEKAEKLRELHQERGPGRRQGFDDEDSDDDR